MTFCQRRTIALRRGKDVLKKMETMKELQFQQHVAVKETYESLIVKLQVHLSSQFKLHIHH